jgi:hypothetical protein
MPPVEAIDDALAAEAEELDGYFSDAPVRPTNNHHRGDAVLTVTPCIRIR